MEPTTWQKAKLKEYVDLTEGDFSLVKIQDLSPLEQMAIVDELYDYFLKLFKKQGKRRLMNALQKKAGLFLMSDDTIDINYTWSTGVGYLWYLLDKDKNGKGRQ